MLHLLVDFLSGIIRIIAAACVIGGAAVGYMMAPDLQVEPWIGGLIGFSAGFLAASLGGGLIACLILIENHLRVLADAQIRHDRQPQKVEASAQEVEEAPAPPAYQPYRRLYTYQQPVQSTDDHTVGKSGPDSPEKSEK